MRTLAIFCGVAMVCVALAIASPVPAATRYMKSAQDPAQTEPRPQIETGTPRGNHKTKVWTNDDLVATRTPMDVYIFEKEAQAAAMESAAFNDMMSCFVPTNTQGSADETQKEIDKTLQEVSDSEDAVSQARRAVSEAPPNLRLRDQMELAQRTTDLNHAREKLWKLQEHLQEVEKSSGQQSAPPEPATPAPTEQSPATTPPAAEAPPAPSPN
ncbi:MAG: hypothetical protein WA715_23370 [Candidatus Acidiferrum sp.]|jgi:hypothetical protein